MKRFSIIVAAFILVVVLSACSQQKKLEPVSIPITMTEYAFNPNTVNVKVGQEVTLQLTNNGQLVHELMIGKDVKQENNLPSGYTTDMFATAGVKPTVEGGTTETGEGAEHMDTGFMVTVAANGGTAKVTFPVTKEMVGTWEMGCFEQNGVHYTAGMKGTFTVQP